MPSCSLTREREREREEERERGGERELLIIERIVSCIFTSSRNIAPKFSPLYPSI